MGSVLALGSVGDPLRRGLARDARARRLDQPLVGAGRLVLEQAGARHVDAGDRDGDARASTTSPTRCSSATARCRSMHPEWAVRAPVVLLTIVAMYLLYKGVGEDVRAARGAPREPRPRDDARLVFPRAPDDDRHALRRADDGVHGARHDRPPDARDARGARVRGEGRRGLRFRLTAWHLVFGAILDLRRPADPLSRLAQLRVPVAPGRPRLSPALGRVSQRLGRRATAGCPATRSAAPRSRRASRTRSPATPTSIGGVLWRTGRRRSSRRCRGCSGRRCSAALLYMSWGERRVRRLAYLGGVVFRGHLDARQGPGRLRPARARHAGVPRRVATGRRRRRAPAAHRPRDRRVRDRRRVCSSSSRWRCPGTSRCTCATGRRSPTG